jgi:hypothetical protein
MRDFDIVDLLLVFIVGLLVMLAFMLIAYEQTNNVNTIKSTATIDQYGTIVVDATLTIPADDSGTRVTIMISEAHSTKSTNVLDYLVAPSNGGDYRVQTAFNSIGMAGNIITVHVNDTIVIVPITKIER